MSPVQAGDNGGIEHFFEREHPGVLRHGEHKVVFLSKPANITSNFINEFFRISSPEENILHCGTSSLVGLCKSNLELNYQVRFQLNMHLLK